ncbi:hypothetical protein CEXT_626781 [Caerostris extrusa]|uniref:Uncharacterized protein n=1 Tax=Caerostris extrusa TaxID=172846 RepID=A0AAV4NDA1_CAEEX|nr:hypothetical protein CEXT_626781 [Caerostris extrusa]
MAKAAFGLAAPLGVLLLSKGLKKFSGQSWIDLLVSINGNFEIHSEILDDISKSDHSLLVMKMKTDLNNNIDS